MSRHLIVCAGCGKPAAVVKKRTRFCSVKCARARQVIPTRPAAERLWKHVRKTETCWLWLGSVSSNGYGHINYGDGTYRPVHVVSYEAVKGPIPIGLVIDHLCRNPLCVNPDHLEPVTQKVNALRGVAPAILLHHQGRCLRGHEFNEQNTYYYKRGPRKGRVAFCKVCKRERRRAVSGNHGS